MRIADLVDFYRKSPGQFTRDRRESFNISRSCLIQPSGYVCAQLEKSLTAMARSGLRISRIWRKQPQTSLLPPTLWRAHLHPSAPAHPLAISKKKPPGNLSGFKRIEAIDLLSCFLVFVLSDFQCMFVLKSETV